MLLEAGCRLESALFFSKDVCLLLARAADRVADEVDEHEQLAAEIATHRAHGAAPFVFCREPTKRQRAILEKPKLIFGGLLTRPRTKNQRFGSTET